jgi:hypothetical protein
MISGVNHNLVARPYAELPSLDDLLKKRWDSADSILLIHGPRDVTLPFRGEAITDYRLNYSYDLNFDPQAPAHLNGEMVWDFVIPQPGDVLHFYWPWGRKGSGRGEDVDYFEERLLTLGQAAKLLPGRQPGKPIAVVTVSRWCLRGLRGTRLRSVMVGGRRCTTKKWIKEFIQNVNSNESWQTGSPNTRTPDQRRRAADQAARDLAAAWRRSKDRTNDPGTAPQEGRS